MSDPKIYTWIFLSLSEEPASISDISGSADIINHALPTEAELRSALAWLAKQGLAKPEGAMHAWTPEGAAFKSRIVSPKMTIRESWEAVEKHFTKMCADGKKA